MKLVGNYKIQDGGRPPCWNFIFAKHGISYLKSNSEENLKFGDSRCNRMKFMGYLKIKMATGHHVGLFLFAAYSISYRIQILKKTYQIW